jgi:hypothetical protein
MDQSPSNPIIESPNLPFSLANQRNDLYYADCLDQYIMDHQFACQRMEIGEIDGWSCCDEVFGGSVRGTRPAGSGTVGAEGTGWRGGLVHE